MNKIKTIILSSLLVFFGLLGVVSPTQVSAQPIDCGDGTTVGGQNAVEEGFTERDCPNFGVDTDTNCDVGPGEDLTRENCTIIDYVVRGINILSAVAGMAIIGSMMIAGYQYMTARDNAGQIEAARKRIVWAVSALLLLIFMYALLEFLVPGGVL